VRSYGAQQIEGSVDVAETFDGSLVVMRIDPDGYAKQKSVDSENLRGIHSS
jgi:hypothetical protein